MNKAIDIESLSKTYPAAWRRPPKEALRGVSLAIDEGETFGFVGPNGAGKSTLIKILVGVLRASKGEAKLFGLPVRDAVARRGLGFVPENASLQDHLTPFEILLMGLRLHGVKVANARTHCRQWLDRFGLSEVSDSALRGFSKGMMQRTALAHALAIRPRLLILDEPLSGLDPVGRREVVDILDEYRQAGGTLFFSSHVLHDVERIADRFGLIHRGSLLTIRSPQDVVADQADMYLLRFRSAAALGASYELRPGLYVIEAHADELAGAIDLVRAGGGVLQDVTPKASLENVFFKTIDASADRV